MLSQYPITQQNRTFNMRKTVILRILVVFFSLKWWQITGYFTFTQFPLVNPMNQQWTTL